MKQKTKQLLLLVLMLAVLLILSLCACTQKQPSQDDPREDPGEENQLTLVADGKSEYVIVRPDDTEKSISSAGVLLNKALKAVSGVGAEITTDYDEALEYEILIGQTNRAESQTAMAHLDDASFLIEVINDKLVIVGKDAGMTAAGVRYLVQNILGYYSAYDYKEQATITIAKDYKYSEVVSMVAKDPRNPDDILIYSTSVLEYGALGDGVTDDTKAFQSALDAVRKMGGGTVYVPAGQYLIKGSLTVGRSVYLVGEWENPEKNPQGMHKGTVLLATGNQGKSDNAKALLTIGASAGVMGLTIYYPEQSADNPVAYPPALRIRDALAGDGSQHASSVQCVTLVNAYRGLAADEGLQLPTVRDLYMTALNYGFSMNGCYDCARLITLHVGPSYWANYAGLDQVKIAALTKKNTTGMILKRTDAQMMYDFSFISCKTAISEERDTTNNGETAGGSSIAELVISDCVIGIHDEYNSFSVSDAVIECSGKGALCVKITDDTAATSSLRFYNCSFSNADGECIEIDYSAAGQLSVQNCSFKSWKGEYAVYADGGVVMINNTDFAGSGNAVYLSQTVKSAAVAYNHFSESITKPIECKLDDTRALTESVSRDISEATSSLMEIPTAPVIAGTEQIFNVKDYGAKADGKNDDTGAFQKALKAAKEAGGGIVYVPAGYYNVCGSLTIPTNVELRGISECMHVSSGEGSVLYVTEGQGEADDVAFITMEKHSGVRGLQFWYPEQAWNNVKSYPYTICVMGQDCSLRNICLGNTYQGIDMASADCGGHYVENISGCVMSNGIALDGSTKAGVIMNTHFNVTFYYNVGTNAKLTDASGNFSYDMFTPMMGYLNQNMTAYRFGSTVDEKMLFVFNYRARYGMEFTGGFDGTIIGCGVDGSLCGIKITGEYEKELKLLAFSDDIVPGDTPEGNLAIYVNVDDASTIHFIEGGVSSYNYVPSSLVVLENGNLILDDFRASVTPASGNGAIRVKKGNAKIGGIYFGHVGRLDKDGAFQQQENAKNTIDVRVDKNGSLTLYSAIGLRFFNDKIEGTTDTYNYVIAK